MKRVERVRFGLKWTGKRWERELYEVEFDDSDPDWRVKALAELHPQSDEAWVVRSVPLTRAERAAAEARFREWEKDL